MNRKKKNKIFKFLKSLFKKVNIDKNRKGLENKKRIKNYNNLHKRYIKEKKIQKIIDKKLKK